MSPLLMTISSRVSDVREQRDDAGQLGIRVREFLRAENICLRLRRLQQPFRRSVDCWESQGYVACGSCLETGVPSSSYRNSGGTIWNTFRTNQSGNSGISKRTSADHSTSLSPPTKLNASVSGRSMCTCFRIGFAAGDHSGGIQHVHFFEESMPVRRFCSSRCPTWPILAPAL